MTFTEFVDSYLFNPYNSPANPSDASEEHFIRRSKIYYLHYLAQLGRVGPIRAYLRELSGRGDVSKLINDHSQYDFWYGTPLHTAADWNADAAVARVLVEFGANPMIEDCYGDTPGGHAGTNMISPFDFELPLKEVGDDGEAVYYTRYPDDFTDMDRYLENLQNNVRTSYQDE